MRVCLQPVPHKLVERFPRRFVLDALDDLAREGVEQHLPRRLRPDAQKTDAKQTNKNLLLSDAATIDTKPQLEIYADDVKCTHGATVGQLDEEQVFYLRSRGIDEIDARGILTYAFAADVVERIHLDSLKRRLEGLLHARLDRGRRNG